MIDCSLNPGEGNGTAVPTLTLTPGLAVGQGLCIEAILTCNLLFVELSVLNPTRKTTAMLPSIAIAFCLACGIFAAVRKRCFLISLINDDKREKGKKENGKERKKLREKKRHQRHKPFSLYRLRCKYGIVVEDTKVQKSRLSVG